MAVFVLGLVCALLAALAVWSEHNHQEQRERAERLQQQVDYLVRHHGT
jgi:hypothetical protein